LTNNTFAAIIKLERKMKNKYAIAVKALITIDKIRYVNGKYEKKSKLLLLRNSENDDYRPLEPDFPGGRLELGEDPYIGLKRELTEELGEKIANAVEIDKPLDVCHFERKDGQVVTMIFFWGRLKEKQEIVLSSEHSDYEWVTLETAGSKLNDKMLNAYKRLLEI
jgi:8-oxo-dGTP pyrophosphatase MutT (NUDIX family)